MCALPIDVEIIVYVGISILFRAELKLHVEAL